MGWYSSGSGCTRTSGTSSAARIFPQSKPDPAIFLRAAELAATPPAECLVIEDSANGVAAAKAAGMYCVGYQSEHSAGQDLHRADRVIRHFNELTAADILAI